MTQQIVMRKINELRPYAGNARTHSRRQIGQIAQSIERFGFTNPVLIADDGEILAGHGRVAAARHLGWREVPKRYRKQLTDRCWKEGASRPGSQKKRTWPGD